ncbi:MAG: hypothetical protein MUE71_05085 [Chitinophagaceae bacterium]|nr:hypothetical protein [Chitinophagaceae bacterium]
MKFFGFLLLMQCIFCTAQSAELVKGYIVLPNGDTLRGQIKFGGFRAATNWEEVTFVDESGVEKKYKAQKDEVKGYGYEIMGIRKDFIYFIIKKKYNSQFFERIQKGSSYSVYASSVTNSYGTVDVTDVLYVVEKPSGEYVLVESCGTCPWRKTLTAFLADNPDALAGLENVKAKGLGAYLVSISN